MSFIYKYIARYIKAIFWVNLSFNSIYAGEFIEIDSLSDLQEYAIQDSVKVRLTPGIYRLEDTSDHHFIRFTGSRSHFDLTGAILVIDNQLFREFGVVRGPVGFYCAIDLIGDVIVFEGLTTVNVGGQAGVSSRIEIFNVCGKNVTLKSVDITISGSSPWEYGSLYGISGGDVRKMNGIQVGWPSVGSKLIGCRVHMRAIGHAIFVQGALDTLIERREVDGLLRRTNEILAETSGYAFDRGFKAVKSDYVEGVVVGPGGEVLRDEMISLSEDGIRMYTQGGPQKTPTSETTIRNCSVVRMLRDICRGLSQGADRLYNCEVRDCVAAGFNIGEGDELVACRTDARYAEALSCPYASSQGARVELDILDSRGGLGNCLLATLNGEGHEIVLRIAKRGWYHQASPSRRAVLAVAPFDNAGSRSDLAVFQWKTGLRRASWSPLMLRNESLSKISLPVVERKTEEWLSFMIPFQNLPAVLPV